jgi:hypothetical protein
MQRLNLAAAANPGDLVAARTRMAFSSGWRIAVACLGAVPGAILFQRRPEVS